MIGVSGVWSVPLVGHERGNGSMNPLRKLREAGQSVWLDYLRRGLIAGGGLQELIDEDGVGGVTSNPSIFRKAMGGSTDYEGAIAELAGTGMDARAAFYRIALEDIRAACDLFLPTWRETEGLHGFVSFELEPGLAHDTKGSIVAAKDLAARIDRPNVMIKVPGTPEGVPAVEELTAAGLNVNITLLFSVDRYEEVARAFLRGLRRRVDAGEPIDRIASVASFFVSRVDSKVDARLPNGSPLRGRIAIANAKRAYRRFREVFSGGGWEELAAVGARVQRPLWASTSTKDPELRDVLYVESLVGLDTVNTMPQATIDAFRDHGRVDPAAVSSGLDEAEKALAQLEEMGVSLESITSELVEEGIEAFASDFEALLETIEGKLTRPQVGEPRGGSSLGALGDAVRARVDALQEGSIVRRIWRRDHTVWKDDPTEIVDRLGWLTVADLMHERIDELDAFTKQAATDGFEAAILLGMGGSSLAPEMLMRTFGATGDRLELLVLDTTHPAALARIEAELDLARTLFLVASKSGTTVETLSHLDHFWERTGGAADRFVAITDPETPLAELARERGFRKVWINPEDIGGRYSALSLFGLVPGALIGAPLHELLDGAEEMGTACDACIESKHNPAAWLGAVLGEASLSGRDKLTLMLPEEIASLGSWVEQLIAESTGTEGTGIVPVVGEDLGAPDVYGHDRLFVAYGDHEGLEAIEGAGHPVVRLPYDGPTSLGRELFRWEFATAVAGHVLGINPFDQPNVAEAKQATAEILESGLEEPGFDELPPLLEQVGPGDYLSIHAYLDPTEETAAALHEARMALRDRHAVATTVGFGPRFLHSTGQLHKGGPDTGVFIQVVDADRPRDVEIPGRLYSFGTLIGAQALGDLRSLRSRGRRVARVTLEQLLEEVA